MINDEYILNIFYTDKGKINPHYTRPNWLCKHPEINAYLNNRYIDCTDAVEILYRIKNNIDNRPVCPICGKPVKFVNAFIGYRQTCSVKCSKLIVNTVADINDKNVILNDIIEHGCLNNNKLQDKYLKEHGYYNYISTIYPDSNTKSETIYRLFHNISEKPICKECGNHQAIFQNFNDGYSDYCSAVCEEHHTYRSIEITDSYIINLLYNDNNVIVTRLHTQYFKNVHIYEYLKNRYTDSNSIIETIYRIKNNIVNKPICPICGKPVRFISITKGYSDTCSHECQYKYSCNNEIKKPDIINDNYIMKLYSDALNGCKLRKISLMKDGTYSYLKNRFDNCDIDEAVYRIVNNIEIRPKCPICGNELHFLNLSKGYSDFCSFACTTRHNTITYYKNAYNIDIIKNDNNTTIIKNGCEIHGDITLGDNTFYRRLRVNEKLCPICNAHTITSIETKIISILEKHNIQYILHNRKDIHPLEIDLYLPEFKIGIECNGVYWHSDKRIEQSHHKTKFELCKKQNIRLLTFWENDINNNLLKIENIILSCCQLNQNKVFARKCIVKEIDSKTSKNFIDTYHLQGNINASVRLGLFYNDDLVEVMTFGKLRKPLGHNTKENVYELYRLCSKGNTTVIGGASKLLNHFKNNYNWESIISYCENDISQGNVYEKIGFTFDSDCGLGYCYYDKYGNKVNRFNLRKDKIDDGSGRTADEIAKSLGYLKCYNSGVKKYILTK